MTSYPPQSTLLKRGDPLPSLHLVSTSGVDFHSHLKKGKAFILYFYPKDGTPGCTMEACDFRDLYPEFLKHHIKIYGVSVDPIETHKKFIGKHALPFELLSDPQGDAAKILGIWGEKNMFGRKYWGMDRTTFLILADGTIGYMWPKVKTESHAKEVLEKTVEILKDQNK